ncbi:YczE/YyaS/YitT family protein [Oceanobacillus saliphilus]|uniref:YczE/YyaS/YitT family protein n=1 Tax=Oceanobacillus saliphilus TaxID=2925834 RepID=UPI00201E27CB|nr:YitT family protein [Oceanobacillus saliphilus]
MSYVLRWSIFIVGVMIFSFGIALTINMQHLGIHPWDVLNVAFSNNVGLSIGSWNIIISIVLIIFSLFLDKSYVKLGTFANAILVGMFVDLYLWLDFLPVVTNTWVDVIMMLAGIVIMGFGGGMYNAAGVGSGPRDGFMLSISDKLGAPIGRVRIITESAVLVIGLLIGGPVFLFTFIFTFIQSPIFQYSYLRVGKFVLKMEYNVNRLPGRKHGT